VQKITQQATQIATLKAALRSFLDNNVEDSLKDEGQDAAMAGAELNDHNDTHSEKLDTDEENEHDDLQKPFWDSFDDVYRCLECDYEVVEGLCQFCLAEYDWDLVSRHLKNLRSILTAEKLRKMMSILEAVSASTMRPSRASVASPPVVSLHYAMSILLVSLGL